MLLDHYEEFTDAERQVLERYVTNTNSHVFALRNLPEVIKGALFSRYSRSTLYLRSLLLKEFIGNQEEAAFNEIVGGNVPQQEQTATGQAQLAAIRKAQNFYDRILDGYGDDSIGELGGAHIALENISLLAAKVVEDARIGGSPLEKSTRYVYFDQKVQGEYLFYRDPILMTSAYRDIYINTCNMLFDTYSQLIAPLTTLIEQQLAYDPSISKAAYTAALRAKVLDCLRGLLPASTLTNMGIYGNGRFFEQLLHKMQVSNLVEMQDLGKRMHEELAKIIPSFIRRSDPFHHTHQKFAQFFESMQTELTNIAKQTVTFSKRTMDEGVRLIASDPQAVIKVAAGLLFTHSDKGLDDLIEHCKTLSEEEIARILDAGCGARENRRQKSPRALEMAEFTFEIISDFGAYRDMHRHRMLTQERQLLSCDYGFFLPKELEGTEMQGPYEAAMHKAKEVYDTIASELPEEAQYLVPMGYNIRWYFHVNLRALQWICELRSAAAGHTQYRRMAQALARQVSDAFPAFERFFKFVDYEGYDLGRLQQEQRQQERKSSLL